MKERKNKVIVAISGGLDSSVAAALLKRAGPAPEYGVNFDLVGVFMRFFPDSPRFSEKRAKKVAKILGIPFQVWDLKKEFKKKVINYFLAEYKAGGTPNPCVVCNKEIKFGWLLEKALALGADFVASGHYVRKKEIRDKRQKIGYELLKAKDKEKDQSYFLWQLNQKQLKHILFPIGDYGKKQVRDLAKKYNLPVLDIPESQEICFIQTSISDFLSKYLKAKPGKIVDKKGNSIGKHQGLHFYTIGQRKGLGISGGPWYVLGKNLKTNILVLTKNEKDLGKKELIAENVNWLSGKAPKLPLKVKAKIRYRHQPATAILDYDKRSKVYRLKFMVAQRAITPGQSVVFYQGQEVLGGGIIQKTY